MIICNSAVQYMFLYMLMCLILTSPAGTYPVYGFNCSAVLL